MFVIGAAQLGHRKLAGRALEQPHAEPFFKLRYPAAEAGFGHADGAAGGGKATVIHHLDEVVEIVQILHRVLSSFQK